MFTVENIDFNEPLLDPAEKYHDLLWPKSNEDEDSDNKTISTCVDNPNLQMICRLKNEEQTVSGGGRETETDRQKHRQGQTDG